MSETVDCPRVGAWFGPRCHFEPRFDLSAASPVKINDVFESTMVKILDRHRAKTYVRDVCTTCGRTVERQGGAA